MNAIHLGQNPAKIELASNSILTIPEATFLAFSARLIQENLDRQKNIIFLSTAILLQKDFINWTQTKSTDRKFTSDELDLTTIVPSLWQKTKGHIENLMKDHPEAMRDENLAHIEAEVCEKNLLQQSYPGKAFTLRQAKLLMETSKSLIS